MSTIRRKPQIQRQLNPPRPASLEAPTNQELFKMYLEVTAPRLAGTSPSSVDIYSRDLPAMAQQSPALMGAMMALAAIQTSHLNKERKSIMANAQRHYDVALQGNFAALLHGEQLHTDIPLATSLLLSFYELWNGELVKMGVHMFGGRNIILARGKDAHQTDVGRALLAMFNRTDIGTSTITGNPCFLTNDWWNADPFTHVVIHEDTPTLFACDVALSKLCLIYQKLTHLKRWALDRRRRVWKLAQSENCPDLSELRRKKVSLQHLVESKVEKLDAELEDWCESLPDWFRPVANEPDSDEDINDPLCPDVILPKAHPHPAIALCIAMSNSIQLQLFRVSHPSPPCLPPHLGSRAHTILRIYEYLPVEYQVSILPFIFVAGIELRRPSHQGQLLARMQKDFNEGGLYGLNFVRDALAYSYHKLASGPQSRPSGGFVGVKEGAEVRFQGISENMWNAEGVLGMLEALSLYDSEDLEEGRRYNYKGDFEAVVPSAETESHVKVGYELLEETAQSSMASYDYSSPNPPATIDIPETRENQGYMDYPGGGHSGVAMPATTSDHLSWQERQLLERGLALSVDQH
ncbi:hypothetical protein BJ508DRAFT_210904 [Ascobolus immersus RN42]|uniref:Transcription factor domain-containing protein n=1 Tax=Ascobolus immersus RN42 TaxID=1160509 RepID=A0A3N4IDB9_ASCIM|nr:hypothetical protein BJ508DRAFT_210904 [Ascobolus immersus RN42]